MEEGKIGSFGWELTRLLEGRVTGRWRSLAVMARRSPRRNVEKGGNVASAEHDVTAW
jgi:hypothetical protein